MTGGQTVVNEWIIVGGVAMSVCSEAEFIRPVNAQVGDVIVLTKPLGTQVAVNAHEWIFIEEKFQSIKDIISIDDIEIAFGKASLQMSRLNRNAAKLMHKYKAHCATDVTGFGIIGHSSNLAKYQTAEVDFLIHTMPILKDMVKVDEHLKGKWKVLKGFSAETSGGLFVCLPDRKSAELYCEELQTLDGAGCWIIGDVVKGNRTSKLLDNFKILEI